MSAPTALYRRYRPDSFADVIGQEHVTAPLMAALEKDRVNHAYLFSGPRGCGKTTSARILARCLNCAQGPTSHPCGTCDSCIELARGGTGSLDVIEIDAASHGGVDDARDLRERATFAPIRDRYKIFIIDEAHMVTSAGFNALLKIVEEPPEHIKFIFATTEPDKVIGTIRSRTHHYPFRLVPPEPLMAYLARLCEQEDVPVAPGVLSLVIRAGGGSVRDSLSVLDQLMAGAGTAGLDYELAVDLLGYTHASLLDDVVEALAANDAATVFRSVDRVIQTGHDPRRFVEDLLERFRDLIIVQAMPESAHAILRGTPDELIARMQTQAAQLGAAELSRAADVTNTAFNEMTGATSPRLHLELLGARLLLPGADSSTRGMAARLDAMERRLNYGGAPAGAGSAAAQPSPAQAAAPVQSTTPPLADATPAAPGGGLAAVRAQLAKAKAEAGAQVARRHQDGAPDATDPAAGAPTQAAAPAAPVSTQVPAVQAPGRVPTWDDLDPAPAAPAGQQATAPASQHETAPASAPGAEWAAAPAQASAPEQAAAPAQASAPEQAAAPAQGQAPAPAAQQGPAPQAAGGGTGIEVIRRAWPEILSNLGNIRKASWAMVNQNVVPRAFDGETLRVALPTTALIQTFGNSGHADNLRQAIHTTLGITCQLDPITGDAPDPGSSAEPNPKGPADPGTAGIAGGPRAGNAPASADGRAAVPGDARPDTTALGNPASRTPAPGNPAPVVSAAAGPTTGRPATEQSPAAAPQRPPVQNRPPAPTTPSQPSPAAASPAEAAPAVSPAAATPSSVSPAAPSPAPPSPAAASPAPPSPGAPISAAASAITQSPAPPSPATPSPATPSSATPSPAAAPPAPPSPAPPSLAAPSSLAAPISAAPISAAPSPATPDPLAGNGQPATGAGPGVQFSDWDGPIPEEPSWADEPPFDDWAEPAPQQFRDAPPMPGPPRAAQATAAESARSHPAPAAGGQEPPSSPGHTPEPASGGQAPPSPEAAAQPTAPYRPKVSPISAWTTGWDLPPDKPAETPSGAPKEPAAPRRSQLLAAQAGAAGLNSPQDAPQDWGVSLGGPSRNPVADPGWGTPANAPDWAQPAASPSTSAASTGAPFAGPASGGTAVAKTQPAPGQQESGQPIATPSPAPSGAAGPAALEREGGRNVSGGTASYTPPDAPAAGEKLSRYQRLANSPEAQAGRTRVQARPADTPYVEDVPSEDDVTIEESGVAGQAAVERILGGQLVEERPLNGGSY